MSVKSGFWQYISAFVAIAGAIYSSSLVFIADEAAIEQSMVDTLIARIETLEASVERLNRERAAEAKRHAEQVRQLQNEQTRLTIELSKHYDNGKALKDYLRASPLASWIKVTDIPVGTFPVPVNPRIEMWHINPAYERAIGITDARYRGRTDYEVGHWSYAVSASFRVNDLSALGKMGGECVVEEFPTAESNGRLVQAEVCKWIAEVNGFIAIVGNFRILEKVDD